MKFDKNIMKLISLIERKIGSNVYNPNSYNGWSGKTGCNFRYPVTYEYIDDENHFETQTKSCIYPLTEDNIGSVRYKFGSNHLYIGDAIVDVLCFLEERYNIEFCQLEENLKECED